MSPWHKLLTRPNSGGHFIQLFDADQEALIKNAGHYIWEGLRRGDGVLVIGEPEHERLLTRHLDNLGADLAALFERQQLVFWDAQMTLSQFMAGGQPDWLSFKKVIDAAMRQVRAANGEGLRAYDEMIGFLWKAHQFAGAMLLEQLWNKLLGQCSFTLYSAYSIDVFGEEFEVANLDNLLSPHTHLVPAQPDGRLDTAINRSLDEILGPRADVLRGLIKSHHRSWAIMPSAEAIVLWLRKNLPEQADQILRRARYHYRLLPAR